MSKIILGILAIIALFVIVFYKDGALFWRFTDWLGDLFIERMRTDRQL